MSNVTRLPPFSKTVHVEADIPISQRDEFERAIVDIIAGGDRPCLSLFRDGSSRVCGVRACGLLL
jgi:hypothetical protein